MSDNFKCKECDESTLTEEAERLDLVCWCSQKCSDAWHAKIEKQGKIWRQWSAYMCGEAKCPRSMMHLVEPVGPLTDVERDGPIFDAVVSAGDTGGRRCGKCGKEGHNARSCGRDAPPKKRKKRRKKKSTPGKTNVHGEKARKVTSKNADGRQYKCRLCNGMGHNARTCEGRPLESAEPSAPKPRSVALRKKKKADNKQYKCGKCSGLGHNARTCKRGRA